MFTRLLCISTLLVLAHCGMGVFAQPAIQIEGGKKLDLGTILRGTVVEHKVTIKNTGNAPLELGEVEASCGCTGTVLSRSSVRPGESGLLSITFNSRNFSGKVHKTVAVHSNASNEQRTVIEFSANVIDEIRIVPAHIWFKDAEVGTTSRLKLSVKNNGKDPLKLTGWRSPLAGFTVLLPSEPIAYGDSVEVTVEFCPSKPAPMISDAMFLTTSNPRQTELFIPIYGSAKEFRFE